MDKIRKLLSPRREEASTADLQLMKTSHLISSLCQSDSQLLGLTQELKTKEATISHLSALLQESKEELYQARASQRASEIQLEQAKQLLTADAQQVLGATEELVAAVEQTTAAFQRLETQPDAPATSFDPVSLAHPLNTPVAKSFIALSETVRQVFQQMLETQEKETQKIETLQDQLDDLTYQHQAKLDSLKDELKEARAKAVDSEKLVRKQTSKIAKLRHILKSSDHSGPSQGSVPNQVAETLQQIKAKLDRAYKSLFVEISRSTDANGSFYSMNSAAFCSIEKELNGLLLSLHESLESDIFAAPKWNPKLVRSIKTSKVDDLSRVLIAKAQQKPS